MPPIISRRELLKRMVLAFGAVLLPQTRTGARTARVYLDVPFLFQHHTLSCEVAALRMVARFWGVGWSEDELLRLMPADPTQPRLVAGQVIWADPNRVIPGNVNGWQLYRGGMQEHPERVRQGLWGYGIHAPAIANLATRIGLRAEVFDDVSHVYHSIDRGKVPIVIVPDGGRPVAESWVWSTPQGQPIRVMNREHSVVVTGYNAEQVWVNDPKGKVARYDRDVFEQAFRLLRSAVAITRRIRSGPGRYFAL